jgi:uncharacterized membrane protein YgcG
VLFVKFMSALKAAVTAFLAFAGLVALATAASAIPPLNSLPDLVTDHANILGGNISDITAAQERYKAETGGQFYVVTINSFDNMSPEQWAQTTARNAGLNNKDFLLAIAVDDPTYQVQHGEQIRFDPAVSNRLVGEMDDYLSAGLDGSATWQASIVNVINAVQREVVTPAAATDSPAPTATAPNPGVGTTPGANTAVEASTGGGLPWWGWVLIVLGVLVAAFGAWLAMGKYNEKRLAQRAANPFNV